MSIATTTSSRRLAPAMAGRPLQRELGLKAAAKPAAAAPVAAPTTAPTAAAPPAGLPMSARLGITSGPAFLGMQMLETIGARGRAPWHTLWWVAEGVDRYASPKVFGKRLAPKPVVDVMQVGAAMSLTKFAASLVPGAMKEIRGNAPNGGAGPVMKAMVTRPEGKPALPGAIADAFKELRTGKDIPAKALGAMFLAQNVAFALAGAAGVVGFVEHLGKPGPKQFVSSKAGRGAVLGGVSGATMLAMMALHNTPIGTFSFLATSASFVLQEMNTRGWLDMILGGDKPAPAAAKTLPAQTGVAPIATPPA